MCVCVCVCVCLLVFVTMCACMYVSYCVCAPAVCVTAQTDRYVEGDGWRWSDGRLNYVEKSAVLFGPLLIGR